MVNNWFQFVIYLVYGLELKEYVTLLPIPPTIKRVCTEILHLRVWMKETVYCGEQC